MLALRVQITQVPYGERIHDGTTINTLGFLPKSVVLNGGGIIAIEYAMIFKQIGCDVYMLIRGIMGKSLENVGIDRDIATTLVDSLRKAGVIILEETSFVSCDVAESGRRPSGAAS